MLSKRTSILIAIALLLKLALFLYAAVFAPEAKLQADSHSYLDSSAAFFPERTFGKFTGNGSINPEFYRTPGYPLFLGVFHGLLKIPLNGILILQILMTFLSALIVYKAADTIEPRLGTCAFFIILFDPAITIYSLMILTESLYVLLMSAFLFSTVQYIRNRNSKDLILSALILTVATYVRPVSFYLGGVLAVFLLITNKTGFKKGVIHLFIFIFIVYSLLFLWSWRNYQHFRRFQFSNIANATVNLKGLYKSYERNEDPHSQGLSPPVYYLNVGSRNVISLMTRPASLKYFDSDILKKAGKLLAYPWIAFWLIGFWAGICRIKGNPSLQFLGFVVLYFIIVTVGGTMWGSGPRFRVPMMPFIAIIASFGWSKLLQLKKQ